MKTPDVIRQALHSNRPFRFTTTSGRVVEVPHSDFALLTHSGRVLVVNTQGDYTESFDVQLIESLQQLDATTA